jgi:acyl carrier protein
MAYIMLYILLCCNKDGQIVITIINRKGESIMFEKMKEIIADQLSVDASEVELTSNFKEDLGADSLDLFELVMALEEEYDVEIPAEELENIATVEDVMEYLKAHGVEA